MPGPHESSAQDGASTSPGLRELLDERAIREVVLRYCRGIDRMDRELVLSCYHPDATDSHGSFEGSAHDFVDFAWKLLARFDTTMHFVGNLLIELAGDRARCETYAIAFHRGDPALPERNLVTGCRYIDRFERRGGPWRIARRVVTTEWVRIDAPEHWWTFPASLRRGARDRSDPVYVPLD